MSFSGVRILVRRAGEV